MFRLYDWEQILASVRRQVSVWFLGQGNYLDFSIIMADMQSVDPGLSPAETDEIAEIVFRFETTGRTRCAVFYAYFAPLWHIQLW